MAKSKTNKWDKEAHRGYWLHRGWFPCKTLLSPGSFTLPSTQPLEAPAYMKPTFTKTIKKSERVW